MTTLGIQCIATGLLMVLSYIIGVRQGRSFEKRRVTIEFQRVIHKLLRFASLQDYKSLHLMLHDLVDDDPPPVDPLVDQLDSKPKMTDIIETRSDDSESFE